MANEEELALCHNLYVDAVSKDHLAAAAVLEKRIDHLLDAMNKQRRRSR